MASDIIKRFELAVPDEALEDLQVRLRLSRFPDRETVDDWEQGVPLAEMKRLVNHWMGPYDWRRCERWLNDIGQYTTMIDGLNVHFLHVRSPEPNAVPLLLTHGWPGSIIEFSKVIGPLADPVPYGGDAGDAFHLVVPSIPGYGFSDKPTNPGWNKERVAKAWGELMLRLGYSDYIAQGGDWGAGITQAMGSQKAPGLKAIHLNLPLGFPSAEDQADLTDAEIESLKRFEYHSRWGRAYAMLQSTRPQTLGYGLADSPVGQAAWIYEKFHFWTDRTVSADRRLSLDDILDNIMIYWLGNSGASSGRMYYESSTQFAENIVDLPVGISVFPEEIFRSSRRWNERLYSQLIYWNELSSGGHFAAFEVPELFVEEMRTFSRRLTDHTN